MTRAARLVVLVVALLALGGCDKCGNLPFGLKVCTDTKPRG